MKPLLDTMLALVWVTAYLGLAYAICRYRWARVHQLAPAGRHGYRADKDWGLRLAVFLLGIVFVALGYLLTRAPSP